MESEKFKVHFTDIENCLKALNKWRHTGDCRRREFFGTVCSQLKEAGLVSKLSVVFEEDVDRDRTGQISAGAIDAFEVVSLLEIKNFTETL